MTLQGMRLFYFKQLCLKIRCMKIKKNLNAEGNLLKLFVFRWTQKWLFVVRSALKSLFVVR